MLEYMRRKAQISNCSDGSQKQNTNPDANQQQSQAYQNSERNYSCKAKTTGLSQKTEGSKSLTNQLKARQIQDNCPKLMYKRETALKASISTDFFPSDTQESEEEGRPKVQGVQRCKPVDA